ncbi:MAG: OFA family MFS transporter [Lachnospirales bacterium]
MEFKQNRWRYMIAAMIVALCAGIGYAWSVFQGPIVEDFGWTLSVVSLTFTIQVTTSTIAPVFLSGLQKKIGVKNYLIIGILIYAIGLMLMRFMGSVLYLYLVYGIMIGIGLAMVYPTLAAYSVGLFPDKTGLASGLLACSYGSGAVLWAPIASRIMLNNSVLMVFFIFGCAFAVVMLIFVSLLKNIPEGYADTFDIEKKENTGATVKDYTWQEMVKTPTYAVILVTLVLGCTAGLMIAGHASGMIQDTLGLTPERAAIIVGAYSVFNALGRLFFGVISDKLGRYNTMRILFGVMFVGMILLTFMGSFVFVIALFAVSACYGGFTSMFSPICADNFGIKNLSVNYAFLYLAYGIAGLIGPQLGARAKLISGGYSLAFMVVAVMSIVGIVLVSVLQKMKKTEV